MCGIGTDSSHLYNGRPAFLARRDALFLDPAVQGADRDPGRSSSIRHGEPCRRRGRFAFRGRRHGFPLSSEGPGLEAGGSPVPFGSWPTPSGCRQRASSCALNSRSSLSLASRSARDASRTREKSGHGARKHGPKKPRNAAARAFKALFQRETVMVAPPSGTRSVRGSSASNQVPFYSNGGGPHRAPLAGCPLPRGASASGGQERLQTGRVDPHNSSNPNEPEPPPGAQPVNGGRRHRQPFRHLSHRQQPRQHGPRLQHRCSKRLGKPRDGLGRLDGAGPPRSLNASEGLRMAGNVWTQPPRSSGEGRGEGIEVLEPSPVRTVSCACRCPSCPCCPAGRAR